MTATETPTAVRSMRLLAPESTTKQKEILNELSLFAGTGGGILGGKLLGWNCVCAVELNEYARRILVERQNDGTLPPFPVWDDVRTFGGNEWRGCVDVVSGGFPCQAFSTAARGRNNADNLWPEMRRIVANVAPRYVLAENVSKKAIEAAAQDLSEMGYETLMLAISAQDLGADHTRPRYWLGAYADDESELCSGVHAEVAMLPELRPRVWETYPDESRMADGMANRMERYRATGNGQIPSMVQIAWHTLWRGRGC